MSGLLSEEQLLAWTGFERPGDLRKWLEAKRIPYREAKGKRVVTTQAAVDAALIGAQDNKQSLVEIEL